MAFLNALRGTGTDAAKAELQELVERMQEERQGLEQLVGRAQGASKALGKLADPVTRMSDRLATLERQMAAVEERMPAVSTVRERTDALADRQRALESQVATSASELSGLQTRCTDLTGLVERADALERSLSRFLDAGAPLPALEARADELKARVAEIADACSGLRERQERLAQTTGESAARVEGIERAGQTALRMIDDCRRRTEELEVGIGRLTQVAAGTADAKRQLLSLKSLADQVTQKAAALENQRDALERVAKDVSRLDELVRRVDGAIRQQDEQAAHLHTLAGDIGELRAVYDAVAGRSEEISASQAQIEDQERATRQTLSDLGDQLRRATERFELEHRGLETVSQRITDLRTTLKDGEERLAALDTSTRALAELQTKADKLWSRVDFLTGEVFTLNETPERIRVLRADVQRTHDMLGEVATRAATIEAAKPSVESVVQDLGTLARTHEAIRDALDLMRAARQEMTQVCADQTEAEGRLKSVQRTVADVEDRAGKIDALRPTVDAVRRDAEQVVAAIDVVASRRQFLDETQTRLAELAALGTQLDDRTKAFRSRLDVAEGRFLAVTRQADEAARIEALLTTVARTVGDVSQRTTDVGRSLAALEERSQRLESIAERVRVLGQDVEQRQAALEKASEHLARASQLREEAAGAVQQLGDGTATARQTLAALGAQTAHMEAASRELEGHATKVRTLAGAVEQLDGQLRGWEAARADLRHALDQVGARQATVDALHANIRQMFDLAERTAADLKAALEAQREIRASKASLDALLDRLHDADTASAELERRKQEIEHAEERLGRAEALLIDIQSTLETLNNQKATLDRVMEQAGSLGFQLQQADALIARLRQEREITASVRTALEESGSRAARNGLGLRRTPPENS